MLDSKDLSVLETIVKNELKYYHAGSTVYNMLHSIYIKIIKEKEVIENGNKENNQENDSKGK